MPPKCPICGYNHGQNASCPDQHIANKPAADPAQSAPSAERFVANFPNKFAPVADLCEAYAALRTAQLERERDNWKDSYCMLLELKKKAETAESALRQIVEVYVKFATEHYPWKDPLLEKPICKCGFRFTNKEEFANHVRHALTVAAQTPEEKS